MAIPKSETVWRDLSDDEYERLKASSWATKRESSQLTPREHADFRDRYPQQYAAAMALEALDSGAPLSELRPATIAAMKAVCPDLLSYHRARAEQATAPILAEPWKFKTWSELRPVEKAAWAKADPQGYTAERAANLGAAQ